MQDDSSTANMPTSSSATELRGCCGGSETSASTFSTPRQPILKSVQPYRTQDEYVVVMKEDLAEWLNGIYDLEMTDSDLFDHLETGVLLCRHANYMNDVIARQTGRAAEPVVYRERGVQLRSFQARVNVAAFLTWCRKPPLRLPDTLMFETGDLVCDAVERNERQVALCLLEVGRRGAVFGLPAPELVRLEKEIDNEIRGYSGSGGAGSNGDLESDGGSIATSSSTSSLTSSSPPPLPGLDDVNQIDDLSPDSSRSLSALASESGLTAGSAAATTTVSASTVPANVSPQRRSGLKAPTSYSQEQQQQQPQQQQQHQQPQLQLQQQKPKHHRHKKHPEGIPADGAEMTSETEAAAATARPEYVWQRHKYRPVWDVDMMSLDEMVRQILSRCTCDIQFPMLRVSEGKYKFGDSLNLIFVRILRNHVMVRIGGGWNTLDNYLARHDPCRCGGAAPATNGSTPATASKSATAAPFTTPPGSRDRQPQRSAHRPSGRPSEDVVKRPSSSATRSTGRQNSSSCGDLPSAIVTAAVSVPDIDDVSQSTDGVNSDSLAEMKLTPRRHLPATPAAAATTSATNTTITSEMPALQPSPSTPSAAAAAAARETTRRCSDLQLVAVAASVEMQPEQTPKTTAVRTSRIARRRSDLALTTTDLNDILAPVAAAIAATTTTADQRRSDLQPTSTANVTHRSNQKAEAGAPRSRIARRSSDLALTTTDLQDILAPVAAAIAASDRISCGDSQQTNGVNVDQHRKATTSSRIARRSSDLALTTTDLHDIINSTPRRAASPSCFGSNLRVGGAGVSRSTGRKLPPTSLALQSTTPSAAARRPTRPQSARDSTTDRRKALLHLTDEVASDRKTTTARNSNYHSNQQTTAKNARSSSRNSNASSSRLGNKNSDKNASSTSIASSDSISVERSGSPSGSRKADTTRRASAVAGVTSSFSHSSSSYSSSIGQAVPSIACGGVTSNSALSDVTQCPPGIELGGRGSSRIPVPKQRAKSAGTTRSGGMTRCDSGVDLCLSPSDS